MSSGTYFPPPVKAVEIPKPHGGGTRDARGAYVADRIAQTVVAARLEKAVEPMFHPDSYGYRPGRSALDAVAACRKRCWKKDWVIDLDVEKFFDSVPWDLIVKAVEAHTDRRGWCCMSSGGWLPRCSSPTGPCWSGTGGPRRGQRFRPCWRTCSCTTRSIPGWPGSTRVSSSSGTPTTRWCTAPPSGQAELVLAAIGKRMEQVGLRLHPAKTRIVYCKDGDRRGSHEHTSFTFLGFTFRARAARGKNGKKFTSFLPAVSKDALAKMSAEVRRWRLHLRTWHTMGSLAREINPVVRGWMQYYGAFYRSALLPLLRRINAYLMRWIRKKYKRLAPAKKARACWERVTAQHPRLFAHWAWVPYSWWTG